MSSQIASNAKNWCFTINNPTADLSFDDPGVIAYCVWQKEKGASGTPHYQGYIQFTRRVRLNTVKKYVGVKAHVEVARGTARRNKEYCSKDDGRIDGPYEFGVMKGAAFDPPKRNGIPLTDVCHLSVEEIAHTHPALYIRNARGLHALDEYQQRVRRRDLGWIRPEIIVYHGPTGSGKTKRVYEIEGFEDVYAVAHHGQKLWFDGYAGESIILIDDFAGGVPFRQLLELTGGYPLAIERKGGFVHPTLRKIYITSNLHPDEWYLHSVQKYGLDTEPLQRRLREFGTITAVGCSAPTLVKDRVIAYPYEILNE